MTQCNFATLQLCSFATAVISFLPNCVEQGKISWVDGDEQEVADAADERMQCMGETGTDYTMYSLL